MAGDMEALKYLLCPLLARSAKEQERFYDVFESFWKECVAEQEKTAGLTDASLQQPGDNTKQRRVYGILIWAIPAMALVGALWYFMPRPVNIYIHRPVAAMDYEASNGTLTLKNTSEHYDSTRTHWLITDPETGAVLHSDSAQHTVFRAADGRKKVSVLLKVCARPSEQLPQDTADWPDSLFAAVQQTVLLHCPKPPKANWVIKPQCNCLPSRVEFYVDTDQGNMVSWEMRMGALYVQSTGSSANMTISQAGSMTVKARVVDPQGCETQLDTTFQIGTNKPFLRFQKLAYAAPLFVLEVSGLGWLIALLPLFPAVFFLYRWWKKRYRKSSQKTPDETDAKYAVIDAPPYYIPYRSQEEKITIPREFFRIAEVLRRREESERRTFDASTSITATIEQGGFPVWRERSITRPADYLFLIKHPDEFDQQTRLFQRFARFLEERDAPVIVYYHDGHFERFRNADMPDGIDLRDLYRRHSACRLVVLGDAHELVNVYAHPVPALLKAPLETLLRWPRRLLLTPEPVSAWSYQEALLQQVFPLYPADTRGMLEGLEQLDRLEEYEPEPFERHKTTLLALHPGANPRYCNFNDADACLDYLAGDQQLQRWLRALAVCSRPDWALTIAIGRAIGVEVTHDRLLALSRIPWLRNNQPDDALRLRFLAQLPPDDERAARRALVEELEKVEEQVQEGFARTDWQTSLAVQHFALDPGDSAHRDILERLHQLGLLSGTQQAELDWLVKKAGFVANDGEDAFTTWLQNSKHWLNRELSLALSFALLSGLMLLANYNMLRYPTQFFLSSLQVKKPYYDEAMASNNRAVALHDTAMAETAYSRWLAYAEALQQADTLFGRAVVLRAPVGYALADSNRWALGYNRAARVLNFFLNDAIDTSQPPSPRTGEPYSKTALLAAANLFNELAGKVYWNNTDTRRLEAQHGMGLCHYYLGDMAIARKAYDLIASAAPVYFDTLGMEVNLRTLLNVKLPPPYLRVLVLDAATGAPLSNVEVTPAGSPVVISNSRGMAVYQYRATGNDRQVETTARVQGYRDWTGMTTRWTADGVMDTIRMVLSDRDGDGIPDLEDRCPDERGVVENTGCPKVNSSSADSDADGVPDVDDACPNSPGVAALKGCPDRDGDGIPDLDDRCPDAPGKPALNGCPDSDGDGVSDIEDRCPQNSGNKLLNGCPDADGDGVPDIDDKCPDVPGDELNKGCAFTMPTLPRKVNNFSNFNLMWITNGTDQASAFRDNVQQDISDIAILLEAQISDSIYIIVFDDISSEKLKGITSKKVKKLGMGETYMSGGNLFVRSSDVQESRVLIRKSISNKLIADLFSNKIKRDLFIDGLIEYCGEGWPPEKENELKNLLSANKLEPFNSLEKNYPQIMGQAFWNYIKVEYGAGTISNFLYLARINRSGSSAAIYVTGKTFNKLTEDCLMYYKTKYGIQK